QKNIYHQHKLKIIKTKHQNINHIIKHLNITFGEHPKHSFTSYLETAQIKETVNVSTGKETVKTVLENLNVLLSMERQILKDAADAGDEGTATLMSDDIALQEKEVWMLGAYLG
ncbi:MAG: DNA starvation/stationary phase protection protein, partial [Flavobacteriales bacterium]|nr:DNA starvation/stationary phase protection protein [Flavobacteriales bacterium]